MINNSIIRLSSLNQVLRVLQHCLPYPNFEVVVEANKQLCPKLFPPTATKFHFPRAIKFHFPTFNKKDDKGDNLRWIKTPTNITLRQGSCPLLDNITTKTSPLLQFEKGIHESVRLAILAVFVVVLEAVYMAPCQLFIPTEHMG